MSFLVVLFLALFIGGLLTGNAAVWILSLCMVALCLYAEKVFAKQEEPYMAKAETDTAQKLAEQECECTRSRF